jgi:hypothetical protein
VTGVQTCALPIFQINYHGQREGKPFTTFKPSQRGNHGVGNYTFAGNKKSALSYANNDEKRLYQLYINSNNPQKSLESVFSPEFNQTTGRLQPGYDYLRVGKEQVTAPSNYLKSAIGNILFDMTNPNIYKSIVPYTIPAAIGAGALQQKKQDDPLPRFQTAGTFSTNTLEDRQKAYNTIRPSDYSDINNYTRYLFNNKREEFDDERSEEAFRFYLGLENKPKYLRPTNYRPTINKDKKTTNYYSVDPELENDIFESYKDKVKFNQILSANEIGVKSNFDKSDPSVWEENGSFYKKLVPGDKNLLLGRPMVSNARMLGNFVVSKGKDEKGEYLSYSDQYDFPDWMQKKMKGNPYKIYGRIYYPKKKMEND